MNQSKDGTQRPAIESLDWNTRDQWLRMSVEAAQAGIGPSPCRINQTLDAAAQSVAPAYRIWIGDNLAPESRYSEAVRAIDSAIDTAQTARRFLHEVDPTCCSLLHKAQAAALGLAVFEIGFDEPPSVGSSFHIQKERLR